MRLEGGMAYRIVRNNATLSTYNNVNQNNTSKLSWKQHIIASTVLILVGSIACVIQFVFIHNNPNMKDTFLMGGVRFEEKLIEKENYTKDLEDEQLALQKEIESLHLDNQNIMNEKVKLLINNGSIKNFPSYDYSKLSAPKDIAQLIAYQCKLHCFGSMDEIYSIVAYESKFNTKCNANTSIEDSKGLLQVNVWTNYPKGWDVKKLYNPEFNLDYQLDELYKYYILGKSKGLEGNGLSKFIARYGQRYRYSDKTTRVYVETTIDKYYKEVVNAKIVKS